MSKHDHVIHDNFKRYTVCPTEWSAMALVPAAANPVAPSYQCVPSDATVMVFEEVRLGVFAPVAYQTAEGKMYWDMAYIFDELRSLGGMLTSNKFLKHLQSLCVVANGLTDNDLHCKTVSRR